MENQKKLEPNNFYTILYFKNIEPTFQSDHNDHELIVESLKDMKNDIISKSKQSVDTFLNDVLNNSSYSTIDDINKLKIVFDDNNNKALISFENIEPQEEIVVENQTVEELKDKLAEDSGIKRLTYTKRNA